MTSRCSPSRPHPHRRTRRAFTLVEAVAAIAILALLGSVASRLVLTATTAWHDGATSAQLHEELSIALERITKDLRAIGRDESAPPAPRIASLTPTSIAYNAASSLALSGDELIVVESGAPPVPLLSGVSSFSLLAFDENNDPLPSTLTGAQTRPIRRIEVSITLDRHGVTQTLRTRIYLRSTMSGATP